MLYKQHTSTPTTIQPHSLMNKVWKLPLLQKWRLSKVDDYPEFLKLIVKRWSTSADHRPSDRSKVTYYLCADQELSIANHNSCHVLLPSCIIPTHLSYFRRSLSSTCNVQCDVTSLKLKMHKPLHVNLLCTQLLAFCMDWKRTAKEHALSLNVSRYTSLVVLPSPATLSVSLNHSHSSWLFSHL